MNIYDKAYELANVLKNSPEVKSYKRLQEKVFGVPQAKEMYASFQSKQAALQAKQMMGEEVSEADLAQLRKEYEILAMHPDIRALMDAEQSLGKIIQDLQKIIFEVFAPQQ